jgi:hypothetical protein
MDIRQDRQDCEWLACAAYSTMDQGRYEETADLFTHDAVWVRGGVPVIGKQAILSALQTRSPTDLTRHIVTNVLVQEVNANTARATALFVPLRGPIRENGTVAMTVPSSVGDLAFQFRREQQGWLISSLVPRLVFKA